MKKGLARQERFFAETLVIGVELPRREEGEDEADMLDAVHCGHVFSCENKKVGAHGFDVEEQRSLVAGIAEMVVEVSIAVGEFGGGDPLARRVVLLVFLVGVAGEEPRRRQIEVA